MILRKKIQLVRKIMLSIKRYWLKIYYCAILKEVGKNCFFGSGITIHGNEYIVIGRNVRINDQVVLQSGNGATLVIEDNVTISFGAKIMTGQYLIETKGHNRDIHMYKDIIIHSGVWVGASAIILPGVVIGNNAVVAAGAVVTSNVPPKTLVAGVPAKIIRNFI